MVTIQETELKNGIERAIRKANELAKPILVSDVQEINNIHPLSFFAGGNECYYGERFFWKDPTDEMYLVGLGICEQIQSDFGAESYLPIEEEWKRFTGNSILLDEYNQAGTGPIMFGGFSFDPLKEKTDLWSKFPDTLFHIPKFLLTKVNNKMFLTTNIMCTQYDNHTMLEKVLHDRQQLLLAASKQPLVENAQLLKRLEIAPEEWKNTVHKLIKDLQNDELKKVVLARELRLYFAEDVSIEGVIKQILAEQPRTFAFAFESNGDCFIGASPERLVKKQGTHVFSTCLAGSIARGKTVEEDQQLGQDLLMDEKNLIEHDYVVEMIKDAMEEVCDHVHLPNGPVLMKVRDIQHLYTPVEGTATDRGSLLKLVDLLHPTPALGGLPKRQAVEKIRKIEALDRGFYGGPIGWLDYQGNGEFAVGLRSALIQGDEASLFAGCGIVKDSDVESEYTETNIKFLPMLSAVGGLKK